MYLQNLASIEPRTSLVKFARSPRTDPPGGCPWISDMNLNIGEMVSFNLDPRVIDENGNLQITRIVQGDSTAARSYPSI